MSASWLFHCPMSALTFETFSFLKPFLYIFLFYCVGIVVFREKRQIGLASTSRARRNLCALAVQCLRGGGARIVCQQSPVIVSAAFLSAHAMIQGLGTKDCRLPRFARNKLFTLRSVLTVSSFSQRMHDRMATQTQRSMSMVTATSHLRNHS